MEIPFHRPYITDDEIDAVADCMRNGWLTMGPRTLEFESRIAEFVGSAHAVAVNSGTAALHLALCCIDLKPGEEVILPALTFVSTAEVVRYFGAVPVFADVEPDTHLIDPSKIEPLITDKTRAVIPVHYAGQACDMDAIMKTARSHGLAVIEDAAHALPSYYKNRMIGSIGDITCFSFYATKTITTGEGGMAVTANTEWADKMRTLRLHGISRDAWKRYTKEGSWRYDVVMNGFKYNTTDIASAIGLEQLKKAALMNEKRRLIAEKYQTAFSGDDFVIPYTLKEDRISSWHLYPLKIAESCPVSRDEIIDRLKERGISVSMHFIPIYRFSAYSGNADLKERFSGCESVYKSEISLPIFAGMTDEEADYVIRSVKSICAGR